MTIARTQNIHQLEETHPLLVRLVRELPDVVPDYRAHPDDWSIREILAHLVDDEMYVMRTRSSACGQPWHAQDATAIRLGASRLAA